MTLYTKNPVVIEAVQWTGDNFVDILNWVGPDKFLDIDGDTVSLFVDANQAWLRLDKTEWIIKDRLGFYSCKNDVFIETYMDKSDSGPVDNKYGRVLTEFGHFEEGEPLFIFRARDKLLIDVLEYYKYQCVLAKSPPRHIAGIVDVIVKVTEWQMENGTKTPDSEDSRHWKG